jgi:hypothetical protein
MSLRKCVIFVALLASACHKAQSTAPPIVAGSSAFTSPLAPRQGHAAVALPGGAVLIAGGRNCVSGSFANGQAVPDAFIFDPSSASWTRASPMNQARERAFAVPISRGRALVLGGRNGAQTVAIDEEYDAANDRWIDVPPSRGGVAAVAPLPSGVALVLGLDSTDSAFSQLYDPDAQTFSDGAAPSVGLGFGTAAAPLSDGRVLVTGGSVRTLEGQFQQSQNAQLYDPASGQWTVLPPMLRARSGHALVALAGGAALAAGGELGDGVHVAEATSELFDGAHWILLDTLPTQTLAGAQLVALTSGQVLVAGGFGLAADGTATAPSARAALFDESSGWLARKSLLISRAGHTATLAGDGVLVVGGAASGDPCDASHGAELYKP